MSFYKRRFSSIVVILAIFFVTTNLVMFNLIALPKSTLVYYKPTLKQLSLIQKCYSAFDLNLTNIGQLSKSLINSHPDCTDSDWVSITNDGHLIYNFKYLNASNILIDFCEYQTVKWKTDDFGYVLESAIRVSNGSQLDLNKEFFHISCTPSNAWSGYVSVFARLFKKSQVIKDDKKEKQPINVFVLGLDSVSSEAWVTSLPRSSYYLINKLKANVLKRFNIVGDGTPANLIPFLTSKHEHELPNTIKNTDNSSFVDQAYPFIWNDFAKRLNYATLFGEDWPNIGTFQYRMKGFSKPPTTHYMRPFHLSIENIVSKSPPCSRGRTNIKLNIDYVKDFMNVYKNSGFFGFLFLNEYSHDTNAHLGWIDNDLYNFLENFDNDKSVSDNTVLILLSDHGARFSENRKSIRGLLQERNPFVSVFLPKLFQERYPNEYKQFKLNIDQLTTPMDMHKTLMHLINLESNEPVLIKQERSVSLFSKPKLRRTCTQAGIDSHWCACLNRFEIEVDDFLVKMSKLFVDFINKDILKNHSDDCVELELQNITRVYLLESSIDLDYTNKQSKSSNFDFLNLNLLKAPAVEQGLQRFLFQIITKPNNAFFEFTIDVENNLKDSNYDEYLNYVSIKKDKISRIDKYANTSSCISEKYPDLRKYCYCRSNIF